MRSDWVKCEAAGCQKGAVDSVVSTHRVPAWRRPAIAKPEDECFECGQKIHVCAEHLASALGVIAA